MAQVILKSKVPKGDGYGASFRVITRAGEGSGVGARSGTGARVEISMGGAATGGK